MNNIHGLIKNGTFLKHVILVKCIGIVFAAPTVLQSKVWPLWPGSACAQLEQAHEIFALSDLCTSNIIFDCSDEFYDNND